MPNADTKNSASAKLPIALFDSGMGGLTVLKAINTILPGEDLLYLGDTARLPYGTKGRDTIIRYTIKAAQALVQQGVKMLVVACNTATAAALPTLRKELKPLPVVGVVEPGAHAAALASRNGKIVVVATEATIKREAYQRAILGIRPNADVIGRACTLFVSLAEEGWMDGPLVEGIARRYIGDVFGDGRPDAPDTLLLGCTHFPPLRPALENVVGDGVAIVDSAATTAEWVRSELARRNLARPRTSGGRCRFLTTDNPARFARIGQQFLGRALHPRSVTLIDL
ncbi:MAG: glutamate racemase [Desulfovibrio sp.]|jgi:glutamate racemase|nr:glutamate racemase [Desulfovibrio sp.]